MRRASSQIAQPHPIANAEIANGNGDRLTAHPTSDAMRIAVAITIARRSPSRVMRCPAGMSNTIVPIPRSATIKPARATPAPTDRAASAMIGITAPWPTANTKVGA